jgi:hypothetical protein
MGNAMKSAPVLAFSQVEYSISYHPVMADISMFFTVLFAHVLAGR